jgi:hypothetical protein
MSGDHNMYQSEVTWDLNEGPTELHALVKEFFEKYLNHVEESDNGRLFNPVTIGCCRALMVQPLGELLEQMRVLSGAEQNPLSRSKTSE